MMIPVKEAIILVRQRDRESRQMTHGEVERAAPEGRLVRGHMHRHEQERHEIGLHEDERQSPDDSIFRGCPPCQRTQSDGHAIMAGRPQGTLKV
jgi:hypothetical protein